MLLPHLSHIPNLPRNTKAEPARGHKNQPLPDLHSTFPSCSFLIPLALFFKARGCTVASSDGPGVFNYRGICRASVAEADRRADAAALYQRARSQRGRRLNGRMQPLEKVKRLSQVVQRVRPIPDRTRFVSDRFSNFARLEGEKNPPRAGPQSCDYAAGMFLPQLKSWGFALNCSG